MAHNKKWTKDTCYEEAKKYNTRSEFAKGSSWAYKVARENGWLNDYDCFVDGNKIAGQKRKKWTYETCYKEAKKYNTIGEFCKANNSAYTIAWRNGWLDDYDWFVSGNKITALKRTKWNWKACYEEAKKYNTRTQFFYGSRGAYKAALKNGWLDDYNWFIKRSKTA